MKQIQQILIWVNGKNLKAVQFLLHINYDNLTDQAIFYYSLNDADGNKITDGNVTMDGADYQAWGGSNDYAWNWAAKALGLVII